MESCWVEFQDALSVSEEDLNMIIKRVPTTVQDTEMTKTSKTAILTSQSKSLKEMLGRRDVKIIILCN